MANLRVDKITSTETFETTGSVQFDGSGDYLTISSNSDFAFGTGDFTIEMWVYHTDLTGQQTYFGDTYGNTAGIYTYKTSNNEISLYDTTQRSLSAQNVIQLSTWHHITWTRKDGVLKAFLDGVKVDEDVYTGDFTITQYYIGDTAGTSSGEMVGHISNVRVVKGKALYTENFKPPMRELEVVPGTVLLCCQSKTDASLEKTGKTITANGNAVANELTPGLLTSFPKNGGNSAIKGSVEFDGDYDGLVLSKSTDFQFGTGDFTIEGWFNVSGTGAIRTLFDSRNIDTAADGLFVGINSNDNLYTYGFPGGTGVVNYGIPKHGEWHHFAVVRNGSDGYVFLNGVKVSGSINTSSTNYIHQGATVGQPSTFFADTLYRYKGFISNLRIVKGTALYTGNFIPPTRELKKVPGTVLLCCQDPDDPLTEATGKTITGYGDLARVSDIGELVQNGHFTSNTTNWTAVNGNTTLSVDSGRLKITGGGSGSDYAAARQEMTNLVAGNKYVLKFDFIKSSGNAKAMIRTNTTDSYGTLGVEVANLIMDSEMNATGTYGFHFTALANTMYLNFHAWDSTSSVALFDNISIVPASLETSASNFTPQVGDNRKVTFEGVTKINSDAYFYLPTGDTITRDSRSGRGISLGGAPSPSTARSEVIDYITISSMGNSQDFGNLTQARSINGGCASATRGICAGGYNEPVSSPGYVSTIDYITIAATGNAVFFGDLFEARNGLTGTSNSTRGVFGGGSNPSPSPDTKKNTIDYITIASLGNAINFGDLSQQKRNTGCTGSATRAIWAGGQVGPTITTVMDYVTIASTGHAADFGDLTANRRHCIGSSSSTRGIFAGGTTNPTLIDIIEYVTISSTGNSQDFGNLTDARSEFGGPSNKIRAVFMGGWDSPTYDNRIDYITIATTGNASDFGNLGGGTRGTMAGISDSHGGLG